VAEVFQSEGVRGVLHRPEAPNGKALALTHGAGSNAHAPLLVRLADALAGAGYLVLRYDLPFRQERAKGPPFPARAARDREGVARAVAALRGLGCDRVFAGGHSYGGRQTAMAAAEGLAPADGLVLLSYPLHPPGRPQQMRTAFFPEWRTKALFVQGSADPFGSVEEMRDALALIPAPAELVVMEGSGHDLRRGDVAGAVLAWLAREA
jgi:uncharacterized protein